MAKKKRAVLVVDDDDDLRLLLKTNLESSYQVATAVDGRTAVLRALESSPDVVLLDFSMPGLSGVEAKQIFNLIDPLRPVPVIMVTALDNRSHVLAAMAVGCSDYITKPVKSSVLIERMERVMNKPRPSLEPVFKSLAYTMSASTDGQEKGGAAGEWTVTIRPTANLTIDSARDLFDLVMSLVPVRPFDVMIDMSAVIEIQTDVLDPLSRLRNSLQNLRMRIGVSNLDPKRYPAAPVGILKNLFRD